MIDVSYVRQMADYNQWQNRNVLASADSLDETALDADRGAFFGSIRRTMSHILWADLMWLHRFTGSAPPEGPFGESAEHAGSWRDIMADRPEIDRRIIDWSRGIDPAWLRGELEWWAGSSGSMMRRPCAAAVVHLFNHQTHHRGQVHAMLTAAGARTEPTDVIAMP
jgi:uncharacterized damage-inducible protein DinB